MSILLQNALAIHSSPALCGIKASNLINMKYYDSLEKEIEELSNKYPRIGFYVLKRNINNVLVLVYRKKILENNLFKNDNKLFLEKLGYDITNINSMLNSLKIRMNYDDFPHEIGVFLGYDLEDIKSYIEGDKCLYTGYWKVYSNVEEKIELFNKYTRCKNLVLRMLNKGFPIEIFMR